MTDTLPDPLADAPDLPLAEIAALAARQRKAGGVLMTLVNAAGTRIESQIAKLPDALRSNVAAAVETGLRRAYDLAGRTVSGDAPGPELGERGHRAVAVLSGAVGGFGGLPSALAELPVTITVIFRAIQKIAAWHGFDPADEAVRLECLRVFGSGGPQAQDDGVETSFLGARVAITGGALNRVIATVAPRLATVLGEKLAAQTVPVLGSIAGAGVNWAFLSYYQEMAHVRFGLMKLGQTHDPLRVAEAFRDASLALSTPGS